MSPSTKDAFTWRRYQGQLILLSVRWYLNFTLSYRQRETMRREQGGAVDHARVFRGGQRDGPALAKRCRAFRKPTNRSDRSDET